MKKILTYSLMSLAVLGFLGIGAVGVQAEINDGNYPPIVKKLAERFNLNIDEVKGFFDEVRQERRLQMPEFTPLTDEQKEALSAKREEMRQELEALKDLSPEERQARMEEMREEMKTWAEENGIDSRFMLGFGFKGPRGFGGGFGRGSCLKE